MAQLIDGKKISKEIKDELKAEVAELLKQGKTCALAVIQVGDDPASSVYVGNKKKACAYIGIESLSYELPESTTEEELLSLIDKLNKDPKVHADAVEFDELTYLEVLQRELKVMDSTATSLCKDNNIPLVVFGINEPKNMVKIIDGENIGTIVE